MSGGPFSYGAALVIGAGSGVGPATARLLARQGAAVALVGRSAPALERVAESIRAEGGRACSICGDIETPEVMEEAVAETVARLGPLQWAVNNAGALSEDHDRHELAAGAQEEHVRIDLPGFFYAMRAELPAIEAAGGGAVVNVTSVFGDCGLPVPASYSAGAPGRFGIARSTARYWSARGIRINELQPRVVRRPVTDDGDRALEEVERFAPSVTPGRPWQPDEVAAVIAFLLSDHASYVTGAHLAVDGRLLA